MLKVLEEKLINNEIKYSYLDGKTPAKQRLIDVEKFNKSSTPVYLISLKAGGVGLNLTSASNVIVFDPWWNPAVEMQAIDRAHRIGQKNVVQVFKFITKGSIEEKIQILQSEKKELINSIVGDEEQFISKLSTEQLKYLLMEEFIEKLL